MATTLNFNNSGVPVNNAGHGTSHGVIVGRKNGNATSGFYYQDSEFITNTGSLNTTGFYTGIYADGDPASILSITNQGTLLLPEGGHGFPLLVGIEIKQNAAITNTSAGFIQAGLPIAIATATGSQGTVVNHGTIQSLYTTAIWGFVSVTNAADGQIFGGISDNSAPTATTSVVNYGTIHGGITTAAGVTNGSSSNTTALIQLAQGRILTSGTVTNFGTLVGTGTSTAVDSAIAVVNGASGVTSALISSGNYGIHTPSGTPIPTITNFGTVNAGNFGIIGSNMTVVNGPSGATVALIRGGHVGLSAGNLSTVTNFGTIVGYGAASTGINAGGTITNGISGGTIGFITGDKFGIYSPKFLTNYGTIAATGTTGAGVLLKSDTTMINHGLIAGTGGSGADGLRDIATSAYNGTDGTITGARYGVLLNSSGGGLINAGLITTTGTSAAVFNSSYSEPITNTSTGTISGSAYGIFEQAQPGLVVNYGLITGVVGVNRAAKLVTGGTIIGTGGTAVTGASTVVILPGASFTGKVIQAGPEPLHFGGSGTVGTISGLEVDFLGAFRIDSGAHWLITGNNPVGANVFEVFGEADLAGGSLDGSTVANGDFVVNAGGKFFGFGTVSGSGFNTGTIEAHGGTLLMVGSFFTSGSGTFVIDSGAALQFTQGNDRKIAFNGPNAKLIYGATAYSPGTLTITGATQSDQFDLRGVTAIAAVISGGTLTVSRTAGAPLSYALTTPGMVNPIALIAPDGSGGSMLTFAGDDTYIVNSPADIVTEGVGWGTDSVTASINYTLPANVENLTLTGTAKRGIGNTLANTITGNSQANDLRGGNGNDTLNGASGNDTLNGGIGNDSLTGGLGDDTLIGGPGLDRFAIDAGNDSITDLGLGGGEILLVSAGASVTATLAAPWTATAATSNNGAATILAAGFDAKVAATTGTSGWTLTNAGSATSVKLTGSAKSDTITGGTGNDTISAGNGADSLMGGIGADSLDGGANNDTLNGGPGADFLTGGTGPDHFILALGEAAGDTITDFLPGTDHLDLTGFGKPAGGASFIKLTPTDWQITPVGAGTPEVVHFPNAPAITAGDVKFI